MLLVSLMLVMIMILPEWESGLCKTIVKHKMAKHLVSIQCEVVMEWLDVVLGHNNPAVI